jgi:hypothetical protein
MEVEWLLAFVPPGTVAAPGPGMLYLDVGGSFGPGVIDHHHGTTRPCSAARQVYDRPDFAYGHLVDAWRSRIHPGGSATRCVLRLVLHDGPDLDAMTSACLVRHLVEEGAFPTWSRAAVEYADRVDQGHERLGRGPQGYALYPLILMVMNVGEDLLRAHAATCLGREYRGDELRAWLGIGLVEEIHRAGPHDSSGLPAAWAELVRELSERLDADRETYERLVREADGPDPILRRLGAIRVPSDEDGRTVEVNGAAIVRPHDCACNKLYMRSEGLDGHPAPLTVIRMRESPGMKPGRSQFVIALDPDAKVGERRPNLRGLGAALEELEQERRKQLGIEAIAERQGPARYPEHPGIKDPWYDGRGHEYTIVDSPFSGSVLSFRDIESLLCEIAAGPDFSGPFWEPTVRGSVIAPHADPRDARSGRSRGGGRRLDRLREEVQAFRTGGTWSRDFLVVAVDVSEAWGSRPIERLARIVVGGEYRIIEIDLGRCHVGYLGVLVVRRPGMDGFDCEVSVDGVMSGVKPIVQLVRNLEEIQGRVSGDRDAGAASAAGCRSLLRDFTASVADFRMGQSRERSADVIDVVREIEDRIDLEERIVGLGQLIERLTEDSQRSLAAQLNRVVLALGLFGVLQTAAAVTEGFGWAMGKAWVLFLLFVAMLLMCVLLLGGPWLVLIKSWLDRGAWGRRLGDMFLDDIEVDASRRGSPAEPAVNAPDRPVSAMREDR